MNAKDHSANAETKSVQARYYKTLDRFNFCGNEKSWQVVLITSAGNISALWNAEDEPEIHNLVPTDVLDLIDARIQQCWSSNKAEQLQRVAVIREQIDAMDIAWLTAELAIADAAHERAKRRLALFVNAQELPA